MIYYLEVSHCHESCSVILGGHTFVSESYFFYGIFFSKAPFYRVESFYCNFRYCLSQFSNIFLINLTTLFVFPYFFLRYRTVQNNIFLICSVELLTVTVRYGTVRYSNLFFRVFCCLPVRYGTVLYFILLHPTLS